MPKIWLDNARITAILAVVILHAAVSAVVDTPLGSPYWWAGNLIDAFSRWCVPVFVMISGALLLAPAKAEPAMLFYRKRMTRILAPLLFWSAFYLGWIYLKGAMKGSPPAPQALLQRLAAGEPYYHLWFLFMLVPLYLVTPLLRQLVARTSRPALLALTIAGFALAITRVIYTHLTGRGPGPFPLWFLNYVPYFLLGHLIATCPWQLAPIVARTVILVSGALTAVGCNELALQRGLASGLYFYDYLSLTVIPMSASVFYLMRHWRYPMLGPILTPQVAALTMGVYLIHPLFIEILQRVGLGPIDFHPALAIPFVALVAACGALAVARFLHRRPYLRRII